MKRNKNRKTKWLGRLVLGSMVALGTTTAAFSQEIEKEDDFFRSSLHATANGMAYWYDKANGGLETLTGIPYPDLPCQDCHVAGCDVCHKKEAEGKLAYSVETAKSAETCLGCHAREAAIMKADKAAETPDVHFAQDMGCMDCHTAREMHGDGTAYKSAKEKGAMDAKCRPCHESLSDSESHTIHEDKLDCQACHVRQVVSCTNCHFDTLVKEGKRVALPVSGWKFLMNYNGKVTAANMQTFVVPGNKTFLIFAPQFSHSVKKEGDKCEDCHATENVKQVLAGKIALTRLEDGKVQQTKGVIPVAEGVRYDSVFQDYENGTWTAISNPAVPKLQYVGYGSPLTKEQMELLAEPQESAK